MAPDAVQQCWQQVMALRLFFLSGVGLKSRLFDDGWFGSVGDEQFWGLVIGTCFGSKALQPAISCLIWLSAVIAI